VTWHSLPGEPTDKDLGISFLFLFAAFAGVAEILLFAIRAELLASVEKSRAARF
jgi:hypothetical protein